DFSKYPRSSWSCLDHFQTMSVPGTDIFSLELLSSTNCETMSADCRLPTLKRDTEMGMRTSMKWALGPAVAFLLSTATGAFAAEVADVLDTYADIALAGYEDSLATAKALDAAIDQL